MSLRTWLWIGTALNAVIFVPAALMGYTTLTFAFDNPVYATVSVAALFLALPLFCVFATFRAWKLHAQRPGDRNAAVMIAAPLLYAAFLMAFVLTS